MVGRIPYYSRYEYKPVISRYARFHLWRIILQITSKDYWVLGSSRWNLRYRVSTSYDYIEQGIS